MKPVGLTIARFQPFHNGHLSVIEQMIDECSEIVIVIGSAQVSHLPDNPFTAGERYQMIRESLQHLKMLSDDPEDAYRNLYRFHIILVQDINRYDLWVRHIESFVPPFNVVYTRSPVIQQLFLEEYPKYEVVEPKRVTRDEDVYQPAVRISASFIRAAMVGTSVQADWRLFVPEGTQNVLKRIKGIERLQRISKEDV